MARSQTEVLTPARHTPNPTRYVCIPRRCPDAPNKEREKDRREGWEEVPRCRARTTISHDRRATSRDSRRLHLAATPSEYLGKLSSRNLSRMGGGVCKSCPGTPRRQGAPPRHGCRLRRQATAATMEPSAASGHAARAPRPTRPAVRAGANVRWLRRPLFASLRPPEGGAGPPPCWLTLKRTISHRRYGLLQNQRGGLTCFRNRTFFFIHMKQSRGF